MELYSQADVDLVGNNIDNIIETIEETRKKLYPRPRDVSDPESSSDMKSIMSTDSTETVSSDSEQSKDKENPSREVIDRIVQITMDFVKEKKRKIYGGYSQNAVIKHKNEADAFYDDEEIPDIDVYSPTPIEDLVELCNKLYTEGYEDVVGREAQHKETYKIFTNGYNAIDLSYVPGNIYNTIPFIEINNIRYVHPSFSMIDLYKMMSEPFFSSWRWKKTIIRLKLLQKHYPFANKNEQVNQMKHNINVKPAFDIIHKFILNNMKIYLCGDFAYNELIKQANVSNINPIDIYSYKIISTDYKNDARTLITQLKDAGLKITFDEYYPFWGFIGNSVDIRYNGELVATICSHSSRCTPVKEVPFMTGKALIGSFDFILLTEMIFSFREKTLNHPKSKEYHDTLISNIIKARKQYFIKENKTLLDDTIFQSFISTCTGDAVDPIMEAKRLRKERKEKKGSAMFSYKPIRELKNKWLFSNTSGSKINNPKNLKLKVD